MSGGTWKTRGCYVWRTRKPHALFGFSLRWCLLAGVVAGLALWAWGGPWWLALLAPFFSGRHTAYVGQTNSRYFRDRQHLYGDSRYGAAGKPWSDLAPRVFPLPVLGHGWKWSREAQEWLYIRLLLPVYNIKDQPKWNPRKVSTTKAQQQRWARDARGTAGRMAVAGMRMAFAALIWIGIGWGVWQAWAG